MTLKQRAAKVFLEEYFPILQRLTDEVIVQPRYYENKERGKVHVYEEDGYHFYVKTETLNPVRSWMGSVIIGRWLVNGEEKQGVFFAYGTISGLEFSQWDEEVERKIRRRLNFYLSCLVAERVAQRLNLPVKKNKICLSDGKSLKVDCSPTEVNVSVKSDRRRSKCLTLSANWNKPDEIINKIVGLAAINFL